MKKLSITAVTALIAFLFVTVVTTNAQAPQILSYPATDEGQTISINSASPYWSSLIQASSDSRTAGQIILNGGGNPTESVSCVGNVCCTTVYYYCFEHRLTHYMTTCWNSGTGEKLDYIQIDE